MYVCMYVCMRACVRECMCVCICVRDIISDKTKYMHSEDSDKLVYLSSLISLHLRYMGNKHNTSLSYWCPLIKMDRLIRVMHIYFYYCSYFF